MAGFEGLEEQKVDNVKPVDLLVFLAGVPALRLTPEFCLRHKPSIIRDVVDFCDVFRLVKPHVGHERVSSPSGERLCRVHSRVVDSSLLDASPGFSIKTPQGSILGSGFWYV